MKIIKAPNKLELDKPSVFLAGSIEMGKAVNWQERIEKSLADEDLIVLNPRRDDWDSSWEQSIKNDQFREQVEWELNAQDVCDLIVMYFDPETKAPITLLELGLYAASEKMVVCCPDGFWRKGNVDIVCNRYKIPMCSDINELCEFVKWHFIVKGELEG